MLVHDASFHLRVVVVSNNFISFSLHFPVELVFVYSPLMNYIFYFFFLSKFAYRVKLFPRWQWRTWHSASGVASEGAKGPSPNERSERGGFPPPTVGSFLILMLAIVRFHAYLWYISLIWKVFIIRKRLFYSRNKYNINVSNYRGQDHDYTIHIIIQFI